MEIVAELSTASFLTHSHLLDLSPSRNRGLPWDGGNENAIAEQNYGEGYIFGRSPPDVSRGRERERGLGVLRVARGQGV